MHRFLLTCIFGCALFTVNAQHYSPTWESLDKRPIPQWYRDAKFGVFIHWGVYAVPGYSTKGNYAEWYQHSLQNKSHNGAEVDYHAKRFGKEVTYYQLAPQFKAELYNPDEWAKLIEKSGAKYIVLTSKHHDGFALWPSKEASATWGFPWNAKEVGPMRDLLGELFTAVRKTSVHAGMYYSLYEWFNPLWLNDKPKYVSEHMWPQMKNLINDYQPDVFWTDGEWEAPDTLWKSREFLTWLYNESPVKDKIVVNDRWGSGIRFHHAGVYTPEYQPDLDFEDHYFEESRGMGFSYGYNREEDAWDYNSPQVMVLHLVDKVSRGGNFLLDIGPDEHGKIPPIMQERLLQIGNWMSANGEAIYGSSRWRQPVQWSEGRRDYKMPSQPMVDDWKTAGDIALKLTVDPEPGYAVKECFFTYNAGTNNLYVILPKIPASKTFTIKNLMLNPGTRVEFLEGKKVIGWTQQGTDIILQLPELPLDHFKTNYSYVIKISNTGRFAANPALHITYPRQTRNPLVTITTRDKDATVRYTLDNTEPSEQSILYTNPITVAKAGLLKAIAYKNGALPSSVIHHELVIYDWQPAIKKSDIKPALAYHAYELKTTTVEHMLDGINPVKEGTATNFSVNHSTRKENSALRYEGYIRIPEDGIYSFHLASDDGSMLWIDGKTVVNNDGLHGNDEKAGAVALKKGLHQLRMDYFNASGDAALKLQWSRDGSMKSTIPADWLFH